MRDQGIESVPHLRLAVDTGVASDEELASHDHLRIRWNEVANKLQSWLQNADAIFDDELPAPSQQSLFRAIEISKLSMDFNAIPPLRVVPTVDMGVSFEWQMNGNNQTLEITADGSAEILFYKNGGLSRTRI